MDHLDDHPLANLFPLIEGEDFDALAADIKARGLHDPIDIYQGKILDGRNRYRALIASGIEIEKQNFRTFHPEFYGDPLAYVLSKNLQRRHLDDNQRASIAGKIVNMGRGRPVAENPPIGGFSTEHAAASLNVAARQVERARVVHERGVPELREALDRGEIAVSRAEQIARLPEQEQHDEAARVLPNGHRAVMGSRIEPADSLDFLPTPPWATRALMECAFPQLGYFGGGGKWSVWEPACGEGHIAEVLGEYFAEVLATDIHDYGYGEVGPIDFLGDMASPEFLGEPYWDWIITNPPFDDKAEKFAARALDLARVGVAIFVPLRWLETIGRYERLFSKQPPTLISFFAERVNLCKGRWDPEGSTATAYIWLVWVKGQQPRAPFWIPPGQREALTRPDDVARFTAHPVIKCESLPPHDPLTGEIIDGAPQMGAVCKPAPAIVLAGGATGAGHSSVDSFEIPDWLRRTA